MPHRDDIETQCTAVGFKLQQKHTQEIGYDFLFTTFEKFALTEKELLQKNQIHEMEANSAG